jgi:hypothetical protein
MSRSVERLSLEGPAGALEAVLEDPLHELRDIVVEAMRNG